jgi:hypothetical protein
MGHDACRAVDEHGDEDLERGGVDCTAVGIVERFDDLRPSQIGSLFFGKRTDGLDYLN